MAKILPAGSNVNLNLGEDPFDKLLKTISIASQAQGVINQANLYSEKRDAIKNESMQTIMLNSIMNMDKENINSINGAEQNLLEIKNNFISENPDLTDDANTFFSTTYRTSIKPLQKLHREFDVSKNKIYNGIRNLDSAILNSDDGLIIEGDVQPFKEEYSNLAKEISLYKLNSQQYNQIMPGLNDNLALDVNSASELLGVLPNQLKGLFDGFEQELSSQLLNGEIEVAQYNAQLKNYFNKTDGNVVSNIMPRLEGEMNTLYKKQYIPQKSFLDSIKSDSVPRLLDELDDKQKNYYDSSSGIYYYDNKPLNNTVDDTGNKEELAKAKNIAIAQMEQIMIPIRANIKNKDELYKQYNLQTGMGETSYASSLVDEGKWSWEKSEEEFELFDPGTTTKSTDVGGLTDVDVDGDGIPDGIDADTTTGDQQKQESNVGKVYDSISDFAIEYGDDAALIGTAAYGANKVPQIAKAVKTATTYIQETLNLSSDSVIDLFNDVDFKEAGKQLSSIDKKILEFKKTLPEGTIMKFKVGSKNFNTYKTLIKEKNDIVTNSKYANRLIAKMEAGHFPDFKVDKDNIPAFRKKMLNFLKDSDKWDINSIKRTVSKGLKEAYRTPKDLLNVVTKGSMKIGPLDAAIHTWLWMPENTKIGYKVAGSTLAGFTAKRIITAVKERGFTPFLNDPKLKSEIGKFLMKKAPWTLAKIGIKGTAGAAAVGSGVGTGIGVAMAAWTVNDIRKLVKAWPEIRQMMAESIKRQDISNDGTNDKPLIFKPDTE